MVIADFQVKDKISRPRFLQKTFLVTNTKFDVILGMLFLKISNADMLFDKEIFTWKIYTTNNALPTTKQVQIVDSEEFVIAALDINNKMFVMHITIWKQEEIPVYFENQAQIRALLFDKASTEVPAAYSNYNNIFSVEYAIEFLENTKINKHAIKLEESQQLPFKSIYSLRLVELKILKTYIKTNLANGFIQPFILSIGALILFDRKLDGSFRFYINY